jgi:adenylate kinase
VRTKRPRVEGICDICGGALQERSDDRREAIEARLLAYHEQTAPLIARYRNAGLLITIDGRGTPEQVFARLAEALPGLGR